MQLKTIAISALTVGTAIAQSSTSSAASSTSSGSIVVHVVTVGNANGTLEFSPDNVKAQVGEMVQFQFAPNNHTVTQSTFDQPCQPIALNSNVTGIYSGFMPVSASATDTPTFTIMVNNTTPIWLYCSQGKHCQNGMTMVINENTAKNKTRSLANYAAMAAQAAVNLPGNAVADGTAGSTSSSDTGSGGSATTSSGSAKSTTSSASGIKAPQVLSLGGLLALGMFLFI